MRICPLEDGFGIIRTGSLRIANRMVRRILYRIVFTHTINHPDGHIKRYYDACATRMGKTKARTAAANKLLDIICAVLVRGTPFITR